VAPILRRLITPTRTRARIYDRDGTLIVDSLHLYSRGQILGFDLPPPPAGNESPSLFDRVWRTVNLWLQDSDLPHYRELGDANGNGYPEVAEALGGASNSIVRVNDQGELIVSVAVPIQRFRVLRGALLLSTQGGDIDNIVHAERLAIVRVFVVAASVTILLSFLLAGTIAAPLRRLAEAADRVRHRVRSRPEIPDYSRRRDEIGHLSQAVREMTGALYDRMDAIESFAADVAHELKNPLTSMASAMEMMARARDEETRTRLMEIVRGDVKRIDRLITDISDASRLDAELSREVPEPVDLSRLLATIVEIYRMTDPQRGVTLALDDELPAGTRVLGRDERLGQVFRNLIDNAISFSPENGKVTVTARQREHIATVTVEDEGPGIPPDNLESIFERFYTERPADTFGKNSGLGLSIARQIAASAGGRVRAENRGLNAEGGGGAQLIVELPVAR